MEREASDKSLLCYGDCIMLYHLESTIKSKHQAQNIDRVKVPCIMAYGFLDDTVRIQHIPIDYQIQDIDPGFLPSDACFQDKLFFIAPELKFSVYEELREHKKASQKLAKDAFDGDNREKDFQERQKRIEERYELEKKRNESRLKESKGKPILFKERIHLVHVVSGHYLDSFSEFYEHHSFSVRLSPHISFSSVFEILPVYNTKSSTVHINVNDRVRLKNIKTQYFLNYSTYKKYQSMLDLNSEKGMQSQKSVLDINFSKDRYNRCVVILTDQETMWTTKLIRRPLDINNDYIYSNQIVRVNFPHFQSAMTADYSYLGVSDKEEEVYARQYTGEFGEEQHAMKGLWYIHMNSFVKLNNGDTGPVVFQHFLTEKVITGTGLKQLVYLSDLTGDALKFSLKSSITKESYAGFSSSYNLVCPITASEEKSQLATMVILENYYMRRDNLLENYNNSTLGQTNKDYFNPLLDKDIDELRLPCILNSLESLSQAHCITFSQLSESELYEILFIRSFIKNSTELHLRIMDQEKKRLNYKYVNVLNTMLTKLVAFVMGNEHKLMHINGLSYSDEDSEDNEPVDDGDGDEDSDDDSLPIPNRQMMVRDSGVLDILIKICYLPLKLNNIALTTRTQTLTTLRQTLSLTYDCIRESIAEYRPNEFYASQWLGLILEDTFKNSSNVLRKAEKCLKELIDNNDKILNSRIDRSIINKFVMFLARDPDAKYLELLNVLIVCKGRPVPKNQAELSKIIFSDRRLVEKILVFLQRKTEEKIMVTFKSEPEYAYISLENVENKSEKTDSGKTFRYIVHLFKFLANLCDGQNQFAIQELQSYYPFDTCVNIISNAILSTQLRSSIADLLHCLWFKNKPLASVISSHHLCKEWDSLSSVNVDTEALTQIHIELWNFIKSYLKDTLKQWNAKHSARTDLNFLKSVLVLSVDLICENIFSGDNEVHEMEELVRKMICCNVIDKETELLSDCITLLIRIYQSIIDFSSNLLLQDVLVSIKKSTSSMFTMSKSLEGPSSGKRDNKQVTSKQIMPPDQNSSSDKVVFSPIIGPSGKIGLQNTPLPAHLEGYEREIDAILWHFKNEKDEVRKSITNKFIEYLTVSENEMAVITSLLLYSQTEDERLLLLVFKLVSKVLTKQKEIKSMLKKIVLVKTESERETLYKFEDISKNLLSFSDQLHKSGIVEDNQCDIFCRIVDKILDYPYRELSTVCPYPDLLTKFGTSGISKDIEIVTISNLRNKYLSSNILFQKLNFTLDINSTIDEVVDIIVKKREVPDTQKVQLLNKYYEYLEILYSENSQLKKKTFAKISFMILQQVDSLVPDCLLRFLLFLREWYKDNSKLLNDQDLLVNHCSKLLAIMESISEEESIERIIILDILVKLTELNEEELPNNQKIVLKMIFSTEYLNLFACFAGERLNEYLVNCINNEGNLNKIMQVGKNKIQLSSAAMRFFQFYLRIFIYCTIGVNPFTENFCQRLFTPVIIHELFKLHGLSVEIKQEIVSYIIEVFIKASEPESTDIVFIVEKIFPNAIFEFEGGMKTLTDQSEDFADYVDALILNEITIQPFDSAIESYLMKLTVFFQECLALNFKDMGCESLQKVFEEHILEILQILERFFSKMSIFLKKKITAYILALLEHYKGTNSPVVAETKLFLERNPQSPEMMPILAGMIGKEARKDRESKENNMSLSFNNLIRELLNIIASSSINNKVKKEFTDFSQNLEDSNPNIERIPVTCCKLLKILVESGDSIQKESEIILFCVKLMKSYLKTEEDDRNELQKRQEELVEMDSVDSIRLVFCYTKDEEVQEECVDFLTLLFKDGFKPAQDRMAEIIKRTSNDPKNILLELERMTTQFEKELITICKQKRGEEIKHQFLVGIGYLIKDVLITDGRNRKMELTVRITQVYQLLQLFCEGHYQEMQSLMMMNGGESGGKNSNFLDQAIALYGFFLKYIDTDVSQLVEQVLDFLVEVLQGPHRQNQEYIFKSKFCEFMGDYIEEYLTLTKSLLQANEERLVKMTTHAVKSKPILRFLEKLISKSVLVLHALLEGNTNVTNYFDEVSYHISIESLMKIVQNQCNNYFKENNLENKNPYSIWQMLREPIFDEDLSSIFNVFLLIRTVISAKSIDFNIFIREIEDRNKTICTFLEFNSCSVEVVFMGSVERVFFPKHPASFLISDEDIESFINVVRRDSHVNKLSDLQTFAKQSILKMDYKSMDMNKSSKKTVFIRTIYNNIRFTIVMAALLYCFILLFVDDYDSESFISLDNSNLIFQIGRIFLLVLCVIYFLSFCIVGASFKMNTGWYTIIDSYKKKIEKKIKRTKSEVKREKLEEISNSLSQDSLDVNTKDLIKKLSKARKALGEKPISYFFYIIKSFQILINQTELLFILFSSSLPILAIYYRIDLFIPFMLFDMIVDQYYSALLS